MNASEADDDECLAARARNGDRAAFEALVRRHKDKLYGFVRRYIGSADDGYDVLQNTFVSAWLALRRYDPSRPFLPWLRAIALNKCRDFGRRQKVWRLLRQAFAEESPSVQSTEVGDEERAGTAALAARLDDLDQAIAALPALYKEPLLLTMVSGLSHKEVAQMLKTTPKAIEMRLARARQGILTALRKHR